MTVRHANRYTMTAFVDTVEHRYIFPYMWPQVVKYFIFRALTVAVLLSCVALLWRIRLLTVGRLLLLTGALLKMALLLTVLRVSWKHTRASCQVWVWRPTTWTEPVKKSRQLTITSFKEMLWRFFERPVVGLLPICWLLISILSVTCRGHTCHFHSESRFIQSQSDSSIITVWVLRVQRFNYHQGKTAGSRAHWSSDCVQTGRRRTLPVQRTAAQNLKGTGFSFGLAPSSGKQENLHETRIMTVFKWSSVLWVRQCIYVSHQIFFEVVVL